MSARERLKRVPARKVLAEDIGDLEWNRTPAVGRDKRGYLIIWE